MATETMPETRTEDPTDAALRPMVISQLQQIHALQVGALTMFEGMLKAIRNEDEMPEVSDLLSNMLNAFTQHEQETKRHEQEVSERLRALGAQPARFKEIGMRMAGRARVLMGKAGGQNYGANARDAYVFEHLEIAQYHLLEKVAERAGDTATGEMARSHRGDNCDMGHKIRRNWENVLSLGLASQGVPPARDRQRPEAEPPAAETNAC